MRPVIAFFLIIIVLSIVFFLQNTTAYPIKFLFFKEDISLALVIVISLLIGVVLGIVMPRILKPNVESYKLEENAKRHAEEAAAAESAK